MQKARLLSAEWTANRPPNEIVAVTQGAVRSAYLAGDIEAWQQQLSQNKGNQKKEAGLGRFSLLPRPRKALNLLPSLILLLRRPR